MNYDRRQLTIIIFALVLVISALIYGGLLTFTYIAYHQEDCDFANIDNIELHTGIDVPETRDCDCKYSSRTHTKKSTFTLNMSEAEITSYLAKNSYHMLDGASMHTLPSGLDITPGNKLFVKYGHSNDATYIIVVEPGSSRMFVELRYLV